ncbi:hypothetical protein [Actinomadura xylanilytica]|uniref:hypothetical protein n=1 Tax=Actinomadura xylanilytica TaxID=887459 RepID=UPI00255AD424|nr:hypothetical protein [Actinomadura xylanilytica]MDL4773973.1 hypothetical protein [Actinomadura xylanilytica]
MDGKHKESAPASRIRAVWKRTVPLGLATAAAVTVGAGLDVVHRHQRAGEEQHDAQPAAKQERTEPRYVVGVRGTGAALVVRDVRTGNDVGLPVAAPQGRRFQRVAAKGDGSYVVASYGARKVTFQHLLLDKQGRPKELTEIPEATVPGVSTSWSDLAVSADGDRIAYVTYKGTAGRVEVLSLKTGTRKTWTARSPARIGSLSWSGGTLCLVWSPLRTTAGRTTVPRHQVRALNTAGPSGDLKASRPVLMLPKGAGAAFMSRDGRTIVAGAQQDTQLTLQAYSVQTGKPTKVLWRQKVGGDLSRLDPDHTGRHVLASVSDGRIYAQGTGTLPAADLTDAAW